MTMIMARIIFLVEADVAKALKTEIRARLIRNMFMAAHMARNESTYMVGRICSRLKIDGLELRSTKHIKNTRYKKAAVAANLMKLKMTLMNRGKERFIPRSVFHQPNLLDVNRPGHEA